MESRGVKMIRKKGTYEQRRRRKVGRAGRGRRKYK